MTILITAFDPFGDEGINSASEVMQLIPDKLYDTRIIRQEIPTIFNRSIDAAIQAIEKAQPDAVLCLGQAGGRAAVTVERIAINVSDAPIKDNAGNQPADEPIVPDGPAAHFSTLPIRGIVDAMRAEGIPAAISNSAGAFVCNHLLYGVLHHIHTNALPIRAGFIHVPFLPEQAMKKPAPPPSMAKEDIARAIQAAIKAIGNS